MNIILEVRRTDGRTGLAPKWERTLPKPCPQKAIPFTQETIGHHYIVAATASDYKL
jgi:hypothetical protein